MSGHIKSEQLRELEWGALRAEISRKQESCERIKIGAVGGILAIYAFSIENQSWQNGWVHVALILGVLPLTISSLAYYWILTHRYSGMRMANYIREQIEKASAGNSVLPPIHWETYMTISRHGNRNSGKFGELCVLLFGSTDFRSDEYILLALSTFVAITASGMCWSVAQFAIANNAVRLDWYLIPLATVILIPIYLRCRMTRMQIQAMKNDSVTEEDQPQTGCTHDKLER